MILCIMLALSILFLSPQSKPETVALVFGPEPVRIEIVTLVDAQAEFEQLEALKTRTEAQEKRHAALFYALNTLFDLERVRRDWEATGQKWEGPI